MKIVFTSCMDAERVPKQDVWDQIRTEKAQVLMLLGDQIYMDWGDLGQSNWKRLIEKRGQKGLQAFAEEMHDRYAMQWKQVQFQACIREFVKNNGPEKLLVCWDDHDFAWNNSVGVDSPDHGVPKAVKAISKRLFNQFYTYIRSANPTNEYPDIPPDVYQPLSKEVGVEQFGNLSNDLPFALLDTRWYRQERQKNGLGSVLGKQQTERLTQLVGVGMGLAIVAGGSPLDYSYVWSDQGWRSRRHGDYKEYSTFLLAAKRPVLYLSGDVHDNEFSGRMMLPNGKSSQVVQAISSGAAIGRLGIKFVGPKYGVVAITPKSASAGHVAITLKSKDKDGKPHEIKMPLDFDANGWKGEFKAVSAAASDAIPDAQPLHALTTLRRQKHFPLIGTALEFFDLEDLGETYSIRQNAQQATAEALDVMPSVLDGKLINIQVSCVVDHDSDLPSEQCGTDELMAHAFEVARNKGRKSVLLYTHGHGHHLGSALAQGYALRQTYPGCEPIVFNWDAGQSKGLLAALAGYEIANKGADASLAAYIEALRAFANNARDPRYSHMASIIVCRSAGAILLDKALQDTGWNPALALAGVNRVVLSSPWVKQNDFEKTGLNASFGRLQIPKVVMLNQNDKTLRRADWIDGIGKTLGYDAPPKSVLPSNVYLDYTNSSGVGKLHDFLTIDINPEQHAINTALLVARQFDPSLYGHLLEQQDTPRVFAVKQSKV